MNRPGTDIEDESGGARLSPGQCRAQLQNMPTDVLEAAMGECQRELGVRERCFQRWVAEGKLSKIDAKDRLERMKNAVQIIGLVLDSRIE